MNRNARRRRFLRIWQLGCLACRMRGWLSRPEIHHLNLGEHAGAPRRGDEYTIGLCCWHHRGAPLGAFTVRECARLLGPSMAREPVRFRRAFGSDDALLAKQNALIERADSRVVGRCAA